MIETIQELNYWLALSTIILQVVTAYLFLEYFFLKNKIVAPYIQRWGIHIIFLVSVAGVGMTLLYSEVFGFVPCGLCWLQRVFLYPLSLLSGIALVKIWRKKFAGMADYGIGLSLLGMIIALYQHYLQMGGSELVACPVVGVGADCARRILFEFGYITFPLMSTSLFVFFIAIFLHVRKIEKY